MITVVNLGQKTQFYFLLNVCIFYTSLIIHLVEVSSQHENRNSPKYMKLYFKDPYVDRQWSSCEEQNSDQMKVPCTNYSLCLLMNGKNEDHSSTHSFNKFSILNTNAPLVFPSSFSGTSTYIILWGNNLFPFPTQSTWFCWCDFYFWHVTHKQSPSVSYPFGHKD